MNDQKPRRHSPHMARERPSSKEPRIDFEEVLIFCGALAAVLFVALNEGGMDIVFRQQVGIGLLWGLGLALAFRVLPRSKLDASARRIGIAAVALIAWTALSLIWTESVERSGADLARLLTYVGVVGVSLLGVSRRTWKAAAAGLCVAALVVPVLAVLSRALPDSFPNGSLESLDRLSFPLGYWNALASWAAIATAISLALSADMRSSVVRALALAATPSAGLALYLTYSRGGVLASAIGLGCVLILTRNRVTSVVHAVGAGAVVAGLIAYVRDNPDLVTGSGGEGGAGLVSLLVVGSAGCGLLAAWTPRLRLDGRVPRRTAGLSLSALSVFCVGVLAFNLGSEGLSGAEEDFTGGAYPSQEGDPASRLTTLEGARSGIWGSALEAAGSSPVLGIGPGTFEFWWTRDVPGGEALREPHSLYLGQLAELGVPGLALLALFLILLATGAWRVSSGMRRSSGRALGVALTAGFVAFLCHAAIDWIWESTALTVLVLSGCSVVVASGLVPRSMRSRRRSRAYGYAVAGAAILAGVAIVPGTVSVERVRASASDLVIGRTQEAITTASEGVDAAPWAASPYATLALAKLEAGDLEGARDDAEAATAREPTNWRHWALLAGVAARSGDEAGFHAAIQEAGALNPGLELSRDALLRVLPEPE